MAVTANATFCATVVDEWVRIGVSAAFVAPGSRSTPLALAASEHPEMTVHVFHDERCAAFAALGHGLARGVPAPVVCTSGTAAAHFHAAVIEADLSCVPMLLCTSDRPPELWGVGSPQTIEQTKLYGNAVRQFHQFDPPEDTDPVMWRAQIQEALAATLGSHPGPVHCNFSFRDPLVGLPGQLPPSLADTREPVTQDPGSTPRVQDVLAHINAAAAGEGGVIICGRGQTPPEAALVLGERLGWPVLADHRSGARVAGRAVGHADQLLRDPGFRQQANPQLVVRFGEPHASKELAVWIKQRAAEGALTINAVPWQRSLDPELVDAMQVPEAGLAEQLLLALPDNLEPSGEARRWLAADAAAEAVLQDRLPASEPAISREVVAGVPPGGALVVSSSMPVRDVEWFGPPRGDITVYANRGANGIDGVLSTAVGVALTGVPTTCLIGDVAFLHDSNILIALKGRPIDLTVVLIHNDGGGIFGFLPQYELLDPQRYERLFGTPHGTDFRALAAAHGIACEDFAGASLPSTDQPPIARILLVRTDRTANLEHHQELTAMIQRAVSETPAAWRPG